MADRHQGRDRHRDRHHQDDRHLALHQGLRHVGHHQGRDEDRRSSLHHRLGVRPVVDPLEQMGRVPQRQEAVGSACRWNSSEDQGAAGSAYRPQIVVVQQEASGDLRRSARLLALLVPGVLHLLASVLPAGAARSWVVAVEQLRRAVEHLLGRST